MSGKLQRGQTVVIATHNPGKVREIRDLLAPFGLTVRSAGDLGLAEPEETEKTFTGNARLKAVSAARGANLPALADDSGLEVEALDGAPGIYSARWAGLEKNFDVAMRRVEDELAARGAMDPKARRANFTCALALALPNRDVHVFEGRVFGHLVWPPRGTEGFGYDAMFVPDGHDLTFGEMAPEQKHAMSHRALAFADFVTECLGDDG